MPVLNGPDNFNNQFAVAPDGTISLTTPPFSTAGGTISPGPVIISNAASPPQTTTQAPLLWLSGETATAALLDSYSNTLSPTVIARKARGTAAVPSAVQTGDFLLALNCFGRGATQYSTARAQIGASVLENWTDTAQGTQITLATSTIGTAVLRNRVYVTQGVVIGNPAPDPGQGGLVLNANAAALPAPPVASVMQISNVDGTPTRITVEGFASNGNLTFRRANGTAAAPTALAFNDQIGQLSAFGYGATGYCVSSRAGVGIYAAQAWTDTAQGAVVTFTTTPNGTVATAEAMRIDHSGFVGIGTTAPGAPLDVVGGGSGAKLIVRSPPTGAGNAYNDIQVRNDTNSNLRTLALSYTGSTFPGAYWSGGVTGEQGAIGTTGNFPLTFGTNNTARMLIDNSGNVGIGTATPQAKLEVNQNAANPALYTGAEVTRFAAADSAACIVGAYSFSGAAGGSAPGVVLHKKRGTGAAPTATQLGDNVGFITWNNFDGTNEHQAATINVTAAENTTSTNAGGILNFYTAGIGQTSVTQRMVIDGNGNVGIGTAGPVNKLVVVSNDNNFRIDTPLANQTATLSWGDGGTSRWGIYTTANALHDLGFYSTAMGATVITIKQATGAIIATAAGHQFGTSGGSLSAPTPINTNLLLYNASPTNWAGIGSDVAGVIYFVNGTTTPTTRMVIDGSGNVGVGSTNTGGFKLDVAGQVRMTTSTIPQLQLTAPAAGDTYLRTVNGNRTYSIGIDGATSDFWIYDGTAGRLDIKIASTNGACFNQSGTWSTVSDASVKENVTPYMRGLDAIVALKPVQFRYTKGTPFAEGDKPSRLLFGLIADDVKPHVPEVVGTTTATIGKKEGVTLSTLEPGNLIYALINAVKELNDQGKEMRAKIAALESATVH